MAADSEVVYYVICDFEALEDNQVSLAIGDTVTVLERVNLEWWWVEHEGGVVGYAPANHLSATPIPYDDKWENEEYFTSYGQLKLHAEMLNDAPRTTAYKLAIESGSEWLRDKIVLDVGCGTGILSLFCARYGHPKKVYAIECSDIATYAKQTISRNGYSDTIDVIQSRVEDIKLPHQVDWIISEWMGTLLVFEYMIESVIHTRDKYLKPDGIVWPSEAVLYLVPCTADVAYQSAMGIWNDVYGFDFSPYRSLAADTLTCKPLYNHILKSEDILSQAISIMTLNMKTVTVSELEETQVPFDFLINKSGTLHGFSSWFTVHFNSLPSPHTPVSLSTSPYHPLTHWKQDLLLLDAPLLVTAGQRLKGNIQMIRHKVWRRHLRVILTYSLWADDTKVNEDITKVYKLWR